LQKGRTKYVSMKYSFTNRVLTVADVWNSLSNYIVLCDTINTFKVRLDKFGKIKKLFMISGRKFTNRMSGVVDDLELI